ncbi:MAG: cytochrome C [Deltaproteobacteria bacterium]|nr:cytochrome C [Deltaproteobacteria bacterium]
MPAVGFPHAVHAEALPDADCSSCHPKDKGGLLFSAFKQETYPSYEEAQGLVHGFCVSCHKKAKAGGGKYGPLSADCRSCHTGRTAPAPAWTPVSLTRPLHYRHVKSDKVEAASPAETGDTNCSACHHVYSEEKQQTGYVPGEEDPCAFCHKEAAVVKEDSGLVVRSGRNAAHALCVNCHLADKDKKVEAGPVFCGGCHLAENQEKWKLPKDVPRLKRGQPDAEILWAKPAETKPGETPPPAARAVAFDHLAHEKSLASCQECHHESFDSCRSCHPLQGSEKGERITLAVAMHGAAGDYSCVGCHADRARETTGCAGCHAAMEAKDLAGAECAACHAVEVSPGELAEMSGEKRRAMAKRLAERRRNIAPLPDKKDIPETVTIGVLADEYQPARLPHGKIVSALYEKMKENTMAAVFHAEPATMCAGCHHKSPAAIKPPACASCHGKPFVPQAGDRPGLKAAYHGQCMGCHSAMDVEKPADTACEACHPKKESGAGGRTITRKNLSKR